METRIEQRKHQKRRVNRLLGMSFVQIAILVILACVGMITALGLAGFIVYNSSIFQNDPSNPILYSTNTPSITLQLYKESADAYLEKILLSDMPSGFEIDYSKDSYGVFQDEARVTDIGTFAIRQFFNPLFPEDEIIGVIYSVMVYNEVDDAIRDYQKDAQKLSSGKPLIGAYNEGVYEIGVYDETEHLIYIDKLIRKSNVILTVYCIASLSGNTEPTEIVFWSLYYEDLLLSKVN